MKFASFAWTRCFSARLASSRRGEQALGGRVHHDEVARGVGDQDRVRDRIDDEIEAIALGPDFRLRRAKLLVVVLDLLRRAPKVGHVPQDGHDAHAHACIAGRRADQLEEEIGTFGGVHERELARCRCQLLHGAAAERRGEQHVVDGDRPAATLALVLTRREQALGPSVRDDHAALGVGENDRIRHPIEDAVEEVPVPAKAPLGLEAGRAQPRAYEPVAEVLGHPLELGLIRRHRSDQEQSSRGVLLGLYAVERQGQEGRAPREQVACSLSGQDHGLRRGEGLDQRVILRLEVDSEAVDGNPHDPMGGQVNEACPLGVEDEAVPFAHASVLAQPLEASPGHLGRVLAREQEFEKGEPLLGPRLGPARRSHRRSAAGHDLGRLRRPPPRAAPPRGATARGTPPRGAGGGGGELGPERGVLGEYGLLRRDRGRP